MQRTCDECGRGYEARRITSKYCGSACRTRVARRNGAAGRPVEVVAAPAPAAVSAPTSTVAPIEPIAFDPDDAAVTQVTVLALQAAGRLDHPKGRAAVVMARRIDNAHRETGSALASLVRQWEKTLDAATVGAGKEQSPVDRARDELTERRARAAARSA